MRRVSRSASVGVALVPHRRDIPGSGVAAVNGLPDPQMPCPSCHEQMGCSRGLLADRERRLRKGSAFGTDQGGAARAVHSWVGSAQLANQVAAAMCSSAVIRVSTSSRTSRPAWCIMARQSAMVWMVPTVPRIVS